MLTEQQFVAMWRYRATIWRRFVSRIGDHEDANDLVNEAYTRAWRSRHQWEPLKEPEAWLNTIARNVLNDYLKSARVRRRSNVVVDPDRHWFSGLPDRADPSVEEALAGVEQAVDAAAHGTRLATALAALAPRQRAVLVARAIDDLPLTEIAADLGIETTAVKALYTRATQRMRDRLAHITI